jgi:hypothetical protein
MNSTTPPVTGTTHPLPFDSLSPEDFERLCFWLVKRAGFERPEHLGASGNEQGRDIVAWKDGQRWAFQCKRVQRFGPRNAEEEIDKVSMLPESERPVRLVFIVTTSVSDQTRKRARKRSENTITCEFWDLTALDEMVYRHPGLIRRFFQLPISANSVQEKRYQAGTRLGILREQLNLEPSKFIDLLGLPSESAYLDMEANQAEVPLSLLEQIVDLTGVNLDWLKHGGEQMHPVGYLPLRDVRQDLLTLIKQRPRLVLLTVDSPRLFVGICTQVSDYRWHVHKTGMWLKFWHWFDDLWAISHFYAFLYGLSKVFPYQSRGYKIARDEHEQLYSGKVHPCSILSTDISIYSWIIEALLDIEHKEREAPRYAKQYGRWLARVHEEFKKYRSQIDTAIARLAKP